MSGENQPSRRVLKSHPIPARPATAPGEIVLREWRPGEEWATHFHNLQDGGFYYGHYFQTLAEAEADYEQRVKKEVEWEAAQFPAPHSPEIPQHVLDGLRAVREAGTTNMFDWSMVQLQAAALGLPAVAEWLEANRSIYLNALTKL